MVIVGIVTVYLIVQLFSCLCIESHKIYLVTKPRDFTPVSTAKPREQHTGFSFTSCIINKIVNYFLLLQNLFF